MVIGARKPGAPPGSCEPPKDGVPPFHAVRKAIRRAADASRSRARDSTALVVPNGGVISDSGMRGMCALKRG